MRKKLAIFTFILILVVFGIKVFSSIAGQSTQPIIASGNITANVLLVSAVNATAFVDFDTAAAGYSATDKTNFQNALTNNDLIEIMSKTNGAVIYGFARTVGTSATYGSDVFAPLNLANETYWIPSSVTTVIDADSFSSSVSNYLTFLTDLPLGTLYKFNYIAATNATSTQIYRAVPLSAANVVNTHMTSRSTGLENTKFRVGNSGVGTTDITTLSAEQQTAPSSNGLTIGNSPSATSTQNFAFKSANFTYNDPLGYSYRILSSTQYGKEIGSNTITSGTLHLDASNTAMFFHDSIDFSSYTGTDAGSTPYLIAFYDSSGYMASAYGGAVGGSESLDSEAITGWTNSSTTYDTFIVNANGHDLDSVINLSDKTAIVYTNINMTLYKIYKVIVDITLNSGTAPRLLSTRGIGSSSQVVIDSVTDQTKYYTACKNPANGNEDTGLMLSAGGKATNFSLLISQKLLTDVPATGLHLMTTKNGTTRGMASQSSSFNPNTITKVKIYRAY
jgi:hypothetical protein